MLELVNWELSKRSVMIALFCFPLGICSFMSGSVTFLPVPAVSTFTHSLSLQLPKSPLSRCRLNYLTADIHQMTFTYISTYECVNKNELLKYISQEFSFRMKECGLTFFEPIPGLM